MFKTPLLQEKEWEDNTEQNGTLVKNSHIPCFTQSGLFIALFSTK